MIHVTTQLIGQVLSVAFPITVGISVFLCGKGKRIGWLIGFIAQITCGTFGVITGFWGWLLSPIIVGPFFAYNYFKWRRRDREREAQERESLTDEPTLC